MPLCCQDTAGSCSVYSPVNSKVPFHRAAQFSVPGLYHCKGFFLPNYSNLYVSSMNFIRFLLVHFSSLSRSLWGAASRLVPYSLVSSTDLIRVYSDAFSRSLIKTITSQVPGQTPEILHSTKLQVGNDPLTTVV